MCYRQKNPNLFSLSTEKNIEKSVLTILYNLKTADGIEAGFSLNNRPKQAENTHPHSYHLFQDILSHFPYIFLWFSTDLNYILGILNNTKAIIQKY